MVRKMRLAGELAAVGVLAAAATVAVTGGDVSHETPTAKRVAVVAAPPATVYTGPAMPSLPAVSADQHGTPASSGRSVGRSSWRTALYGTPSHEVADIPMRALVAYQWAATVIDLADTQCHLEWPLLGAIAKVESDHGRFGGGSIDSDGRVRPVILGPRLTGSDHTSRIVDTDAGRLDGDLRVDRAVGPFQIVPATWAQVRVDADGDGRRDPQDVDDAALGAAVFLCSGRDDLRTTNGQRQAVRRYNRDGGYVDLVLDVAADYEQADYGQATGLVLLARDNALGSAPWSPTLTLPPTSGHGASFGPAGSPSWTGTTPTNGPTAPAPASPSAPPTPSETTPSQPAPSESTTPTVSPTESPADTPTASPTEEPSETVKPSEEPSETVKPTEERSETVEPTADPTPTLVPEEGTGDTGLSLSTGLSVVLPGSLPLLWMLRRRRTPDGQDD